MIVLLILLRFCTASGVTPPVCVDEAQFQHLLGCVWAIEGTARWDNGWQAWTMRCLVPDTYEALCLHDQVMRWVNVTTGQVLESPEKIRDRQGNWWTCPVHGDMELVNTDDS